MSNEAEQNSDWCAEFKGGPFTDYLERQESSYRGYTGSIYDSGPLFNALRCGEIAISIQAHYGAYSQPREWHPDADIYTAFECAILGPNDTGLVSGAYLSRDGAPKVRHESGLIPYCDVTDVQAICEWLCTQDPMEGASDD